MITRQTTRLYQKMCSHRGRRVPGVLLAGAPSAVQRDDLLPADARFTHRTLLPAGSRLQPLGGATGRNIIQNKSDEPRFYWLNTGVQ